MSVPFADAATTPPKTVVFNFIDYQGLSQPERADWRFALLCAVRGGHKVIFAVPSLKETLAEMLTLMRGTLFPEPQLAGAIMHHGEPLKSFGELRTKAGELFDVDCFDILVSCQMSTAAQMREAIPYAQHIDVKESGGPASLMKRLFPQEPAPVVRAAAAPQAPVRQ